MDTLSTAYKILHALERDKAITPTELKLAPTEWARVLRLLIDEGYVKNAEVFQNITGETMTDVDRAEITLSGAQYLRENSAMRKIAKAVGDVIPLIGGLG